MCLGGDSESSSSAAGSASANVTFTPTITISGNSGEPVQDTADTFAARLLATPPMKITLPEPQNIQPVEAEADIKTTKILALIAVGLVARRLIRG